MSRRDIQAGRASISVKLNDKSVKGQLMGLSRRLKSFGVSVSKIGAGFAAAGTAILAPLTAAAVKFAAAGDKLDTMSKRTGIGAGRLSALGFAAQQSGSDLDSLGGVIQKMNRRVGRITAGLGSKGQIEALNKLGVSVEDLASMNPEQQFLTIADAMKNYGDITEAAGLAQKVFGVGVDGLLPLIQEGSEGINKLTREAEDLGIALTDEDAVAAADFADALDRLEKMMMGIVTQIGAAVAPVLTWLVDLFADITGGVVKFIRDNRTLVVILAGVGFGLLAVGAALTFLGGTVVAVGMMISGTIAIVNGLLLVLNFLLTPVGLVVAAFAAVLAAGAVLGASFIGLMAYTGNLSGIFEELLGTVTRVWGGISDAMMAGDWGLAMKIAWAGVKVAFFEGLDSLQMAVSMTLTNLGFMFANGFRAIASLAASVFMKIWEVIKNPFKAGELLSGLTAEFNNIGAQIAAGMVTATSGSKGELDALIAEAKAKADKFRAEQETEGATLMEELMADATKRAEAAAKLAQDAMDEAAKKADEATANIPVPGENDNSKDMANKLQSAASGSFSAAAAMRLGMGGGTAAERTASASERAADNLDVLVRRTLGGGALFG